MRVALAVCLAISVAAGSLSAARAAHVRLKAGENAKLHVGQIGDLRLGTAHPWSVTLEGDAIAPINPATGNGVHSYRAVHTGTATLLITPTDRKSGECIDCVTRHTFLTVIP